jgi:DNA-binding NarL/FixJ family response regulator
MTVRILIVDDHEAVREGLSYLLDDGSGVTVTATSPGGDDALAKANSADVDAVLLDIQLSGRDGLSLLENLVCQKPDLSVVILSAHDNPTYMARAAALGAADYVLKGDCKRRIVEAVVDAVSGKPMADESRLAQIVKMMQRDTRTENWPAGLPLTPREIQVMRHIGLGLSNKEIAKSLTISVETVKEHVQNILRKVGASDRTDAAVRAVRLGLVG